MDEGRRRRWTLPERSPEPSSVVPDPSAIGGIAAAPFVRLPTMGTLFETRAARCRTLAVGHTLEPFLMFLADVADAQHRMRDADDVLRALLLSDYPHAPEAATQAREHLRSVSAAEQQEIVAAVGAGEFALDRLGECLFAAAAIQVERTRDASSRDASGLVPADGNVCPVCAAPPIASTVVGWTQASKARYCVCGFCATLWNYPRVKCTTCEATSDILHHAIDGGDPNQGIESCDVCHSYIKHFQQHADPAIEPLVDDVASFALDLLARDEGYRRTAVNPLFVAA